MDVSKKTFTAIEAVLYIASSNSASPIRSGEICKYQGVSLRYLEGVLQQLVHENILKSIRGPKGGYVLARDRRKIHLSDIYKIIKSLDCSTKEVSSSPLRKKIIDPLADELEKKLVEHLSTITIKDLCDNVGDHKASKKSDFNI